MSFTPALLVLVLLSLLINLVLMFFCWENPNGNGGTMTTIDLAPRVRVIIGLREEISNYFSVRNVWAHPERRAFTRALIRRRIAALRKLEQEVDHE